MSLDGRFHCLSSPLSLEALLRGTYIGLSVALVLALGTHVLFAEFSGISQDAKLARPLTTQFVKRAPRLTKPLELKKRPQPKQRRVQREMVAVKARMQAVERIPGFQPTQVLKGLARPSTPIGRMAESASEEVEPRTTAGVIEGAKDVEQKLDMSLELLDIETLDTGKYHAMVVQDPEDKHNLKGFCQISWLYISREHDRGLLQSGGVVSNWAGGYLGMPVRNLAEAMNRYTAVDTRVGERAAIDNLGVLRVPWLFHLLFKSYGLSDSDLAALGQYLVEGGFVFADCAPFAMYDVSSSHTRNLEAALKTQGVDASFQIVPGTHPVYHCYFDFTAAPAGYDAFLSMYSLDSQRTEYLEGLEEGGRLVALLSKKGYYAPWGTRPGGGGELSGKDFTRQMQFGVNTIVFALTQEGSITRRLMEGVR